MNITDLIAFRQAEAAGHIKVINQLDNIFDCGPIFIPCNECLFGDQCVNLEDEKIAHFLTSLPEFLLSLDELQSQYPEHFI